VSLRSDLAERLRVLLLRGRAESDLDEELRFHLEREIEARVRAGADPAAARRAARLALGGVERVKEDVRDARGTRPLDECAADIRYALRSLRRSPGFALAVVLVLGLGIGAASAVYAVVDAVLLAPLPYPAAGRLVRIYEQNSPTNRWSLSTADVGAIAARQRSFDAFGAVERGEAALAGAGPPARVPVGRATWGFFAALGVRAERGRLLEAGDGAPGAPDVVVVSDAFARRALDGPDSAVGRSLTLDGVSRTVVGVLEPGRSDLAGIRADLWPALQLRPPVRRGPFWLRGIARLEPGVALDAAARDLAGVSRGLMGLYADWHDSTAVLTPEPLRDAIVGAANRPVGLFAAAIALVLLVAVANVATLLLVRAAGREHELAVRTALGASRTRLARLVLTECAALTGLAGLVALVVAALGVGALARLAPDLPRLAEVGLHARTVIALAAVTLASGALAALAPVAAVLTGRSGGSVRPEHARAGGGRRADRLRRALVVAEFALALPLLLGAGLLLNSFVRLTRVDPGFDPSGAVGVQVSLPAARYPDYPATQTFWRRLEQGASELPGVTAVGLTTGMPPDNGGFEDNFDLVDRPVPSGAAEPVSPWLYVTPGYFAALGVPRLAGRFFGAADSGDAPPVVLVSRAWANRYLPGEDPVGRQLVQGGCYSCPRTTIIGVVGDVKYQGIARDGVAAYGPLLQSRSRTMSLLVRTRLAPGEVFHRLRGVIAGLDPDLPVVETTLADRLDASLADPRRWTIVLGGFGAAAALLAALGVFGLMSYVVRQRRRELGVRLALGAEPETLLFLVVGRGMRYAALGTALGLGLAALEGRWLAALLFGVGALDPATTLGAVALLLLAALAACWLPGLRAARVSPIEVLGAE
jgi:putative ABC transport system permease protein